MAELPRYQMMGIPVPGMPQLDFAAQREQARLAGGISEGLSRISEFAFKEARIKAKEEGLQYGVENPVTNEQIKKAMEEGRPVSELFAQKGTSFGDAARAAQAAQLRIQFESEARIEMARISALADSGKIDINQISSLINAPINGYAKVLASIDPEEAVKFKASASTAGSAVYKSAFDRAIKIGAAGTKARLATTEDATYKVISSIYESTADVESQKGLINLERARYFSALRESNDPAWITQKMNQFEQKVDSLKIDAISTYVSDNTFAKNSVEAISRLDKNDVGNYSGLWKSLSFEQKAKIRNNLRTISSERNEANERDQKAEKKQATLDASENLQRFYQTGDPVALRNLGNISLQHPDVISQETVFKLPKNRIEGLNVEIKNPKAELIIKSEILAGKFRTPQQMSERARELGVGYSVIEGELFTFFVNRDDKEVANVERTIRTEAKIVPGSNNIGVRQSERYIALSKKFNNDWKFALEKSQQDPKYTLPSRQSVLDGIIKKENDSGASKRIKMLQAELRDRNIFTDVNGNKKSRGLSFIDEGDEPSVSAKEIEDGLRNRWRELGFNSEKDPQLQYIINTYKSIEAQQKKRDSQ